MLSPPADRTALTWPLAVGAWGGFSPGARTLGLRSARPAGRRALRCAATGDASEFSSVAAWEAEYEALKNTKTIKAGNPVQEGGNLLTKALPGLAVIGNAVERAINKDSDPQQRAMSDSHLAKEGKKTDQPSADERLPDRQHVRPRQRELYSGYLLGCRGAEEKLMFEGSGGASFSHGTRIAKIDLATCTTTTLSANESPLCTFDSRDVRLTGLLGREWAPADDDSHDDVDCYHCHPMASMVSAKAQNQCEEAREAKQLAFERDTSCTSESTEGQKWSGAGERSRCAAQHLLEERNRVFAGSGWPSASMLMRGAAARATMGPA